MDTSTTPWPFFSRAELACSCCGRMEMDQNFMERLSALRVAFGKPLRITSGYRCPTHNAQASSTGYVGPHVHGQAVDIALSGADVHEVLTLALQRGFTGIGLKQSGPHPGRFLHLDNLTNAPGRPRPTIWTY